MIFQRRGDSMLAITQADHARLAGDIAKIWGNEHASKPEPWGSLVVASVRHDDGWIEWDADPTLDASGSPQDFITVPTEERVEIYRRGVDLVRDEDPHARLLVSMHLTGLFLGRLEPGAPKLIDFLQGRDRELVDEFITEQDAWQEEPPEGMSGSILLSQYRLLQVFDQLSLILCLTTPDRASTTTLHFVPLAEPGAPVEPMQVTTEGRRVKLDPFALASEGMEVSISARVLEEQTFADVSAYRTALASAASEELVFRLEMS